jgi:hypothetical protein
MGSEVRMRDLVVRFTADSDWLPSVSRDITDAIHAELPDLDADPELRASTYASTENVLRLLVDLSWSGIPSREAVPPPAAVDYAREFVRRGLPLDSLLRAFHIGQATFFKRWCEKSHADITRQAELVEAIELGANWTFDYVDTLSQGLVRRYGEERERWVRSAAAVRAQVVDSLLAGEPVDIHASSERLAYELGRNHQAFAAVRAPASRARWSSRVASSLQLSSSQKSHAARQAAEIQRDSPGGRAGSSRNALSAALRIGAAAA